MIKKLRIKFICVIMVIVALMLVSILGTVVHFAGRSMQMQSIEMMHRVANNPFQQGGKEKLPEEMRLPFFRVRLGDQGEVVTVSGNLLDMNDKAHIQQIVDAVLLTGRETGVLREYDLRFLKNTTPRGDVIVFSDTTVEFATLQDLLLGALLIFMVAMLIFLGISVLLSRWVIKPVETAWDQQRQFVADASHELKTPLAVIMANAELMQNEDTGETDRKTYSQNILSTTYQMRSLVENMLEMARVDNGTLNMKFENLDFSQLVEDAVLSVQLLYEEKGLGLRCTAQEGIMLRGSEQHLYQVMDVLLDNALKYSDPNGAVSVMLNQSGRNCILSVASPGEPISKEDLKNIFKRFYRADKARAMNGSYGLGLSIAESIVIAHKGKIWAESKDGCNTFHVQLPAGN